ncbi:MAG TPA: CHRD domain-containing protein [Steroidobacteraceae bacterium]|nr:CHRD domain-containing protein [Steroidobacteraceae bacterium]
MKVSRKIFAIFGLGLIALWVGSALAGDRHHKDEVRARLAGFSEVPLTLSTPGRGRFHAVIDEEEQTITFRLTYGGLEGDVTQAHIHFGKVFIAGGISVFLCSNLGNGPAGTQACPAQNGEVTGTLTPDSIIGPAGQGIAAGEFAELLAAIRAGNTYANVHSTKYPGGEIRGQIHGD